MKRTISLLLTLILLVNLAACIRVPIQRVPQPKEAEAKAAVTAEPTTEPTAEPTAEPTLEPTQTPGKPEWPEGPFHKTR